MRQTNSMQTFAIKYYLHRTENHTNNTSNFHFRPFLLLGRDGDEIFGPEMQTKHLYPWLPCQRNHFYQRKCSHNIILSGWKNLFI